MSFQNLQVEIDQLPRAESIDFRPLAAAYPKLVMIHTVLSLAPLFVASFVPAGLLIFAVGTPVAFVIGPLIPIIPLALAALLIPVSMRRAKRAGYALREHDMAFRRGLLFRKVVILPFNRLQHAEVSSGPLQRKFGLASLKLYTAGASGIDLQIDGLTKDAAEDLRQHVIARTGATGDG